MSVCLEWWASFTLIRLEPAFAPLGTHRLTNLDVFVKTSIIVVHLVVTLAFLQTLSLIALSCNLHLLLSLCRSWRQSLCFSLIPFPCNSVLFCILLTLYHSDHLDDSLQTLAICFSSPTIFFLSGCQITCTEKKSKLLLQHANTDIFVKCQVLRYFNYICTWVAVDSSHTSYSSFVLGLHGHNKPTQHGAWRKSTSRKNIKCGLQQHKTSHKKKQMQKWSSCNSRSWHGDTKSDKTKTDAAATEVLIITEIKW